jgi:ATP-dependent Clp protease ATP-binding subunit ClpC
LPRRGAGAILGLCFERFTQRSRQVVVAAQEESRALKTGHVGTGHILLGVLREHDGVAAQVLESLDITVERARGDVVRIMGVGQETPSGQIPFTPRARRVLELALQEALALGSNYIDPGHILLALTTVNDATSTRILGDCDADPGRIRAEVLQRVARAARSAQPAAGAEPPASGNGFEEWIRVRPGSGVRRLLMVAAARALDEGRENIQPRDVLLALTRDEHTGPVLADLGLDDATILKAIERRRPPRAPAEG